MLIVFSIIKHPFAIKVKIVLMLNVNFPIYFPLNVNCISHTSFILPAGKLSHNYGKSPCFMGKLTISMAIFNSKLLVYQRVSSINPIQITIKSHSNHHKIPLKSHYNPIKIPLTTINPGFFIFHQAFMESSCVIIPSPRP